MADPIKLDIPHKLGLTEAKRRLENGVGQLAGFLPGGKVTHHDRTGDALDFAVEALGQRVAAHLEVFDDRVHVLLDLPPLLSLMARRLTDGLIASGTKLLK